MEKALQDIITSIMEQQRNGILYGGGKFKVPKATTHIEIPLTASQVSLAELRRLKRQFTQLNKFHTQIEPEKVANLFVEYLNANIGRS